jgi:hypothetical protein
LTKHKLFATIYISKHKINKKDKGISIMSQAASAEDYNASIATEAANILADQSVGENIRSLNHFVADHGVPTADEVLLAHEYGKNIIRDEGLNYSDSEGNHLIPDDAEEFLLYADPKTWMLAPEDKAEAESIVATTSWHELTPTQLKELRSPLFRANPNERAGKTYDRYKQEAAERIELSDELTARANRSTMHIVPGDKRNKIQELGITDLVKVNTNGRAVTDRRNKFISNNQLEQIGAHQEHIRDTMPSLHLDVARVDDRGNPLQPDGSEMSSEHVYEVRKHQEQIIKGLPERKKDHGKLFADGSETAPDSPEVAFDKTLSTFLNRIQAKVDGSKDLSKKQLAMLDGKVRDAFDALGLNKTDNPEDYESLVKTLEDGWFKYFMVPRRFGERLRDMRDSVSLTYLSKKAQAKDYLNDEEKGQRRKILAGGIGIVALASAGAAAYHFGVSDHHIAGHRPKGVIPTPSSSRHPHTGGLSASGFGTLSAGGAQHHPAIEMSLGYHGDTISNEVSNYLLSHGYHDSSANINKVTSAVLRHQGISWDDARRLPVDYKFGIPHEVLSQLTER